MPTEFRQVGIRERAERYIRLSAVYLLCIAVSFLAAIVAVGFPADDAQAILFPAILFCLWRIPRSRAHRIPTVVIFLAVVCWFVTSLHVRGYLMHFGGTSHVLWSRLANDPYGVTARELTIRLNEIGKRHDLAPVPLLHRTLPLSASELDQQFEREQDLSVLINGNPEWLSVHLRVRPEEFKLMPLPEHELVVDAYQYGLSGENEFGILPGAAFDVPLALGIAPRHFQVPTANTPVALEYLAWFLDAFAPSSSSDGGTAENRAVWRLRYAASIEGPWKSATPQGVASYLLGNFLLFRAVSNSSIDHGTLTCAIEMHRKAAGKIFRKYEPEIRSLILNDSAVARLLAATELSEFDGARTLLVQASLIVDRNNTPTRGAKLALLNLQTLERAGYF